MAAIQIPYGSLYFSSSSATTLSAATPAKAAGTTAEMLSQDFTASTSNRLTYDGTTTLNFKVSASLSASSVAGAETLDFYIYKNGTVVTGSQIQRKVSNNDVGAVSLECIVSLATDDYVEIWVESLGGDNVVIDYGCVTASLVG